MCVLHQKWENEHLLLMHIEFSNKQRPVTKSFINNRNLIVFMQMPLFLYSVPNWKIIVFPLSYPYPIIYCHVCFSQLEYFPFHACKDKYTLHILWDKMYIDIFYVKLLFFNQVFQRKTTLSVRNSFRIPVKVFPVSRHICLKISQL